MSQEKQSSCLDKLPSHSMLAKELKKKGVGGTLGTIRKELDAKIKHGHDKEYFKSRGLK